MLDREWNRLTDVARADYEHKANSLIEVARQNRRRRKRARLAHEAALEAQALRNTQAARAPPPMPPPPGPPPPVAAVPPIPAVVQCNCNLHRRCGQHAERAGRLNLAFADPRLANSRVGSAADLPLDVCAADAWTCTLPDRALETSINQQFKCMAMRPPQTIPFTLV